MIDSGLYDYWIQLVMVCHHSLFWLDFVVCTYCLIPTQLISLTACMTFPDFINSSNSSLPSFPFMGFFGWLSSCSFLSWNWNINVSHYGNLIINILTYEWNISMKSSFGWLMCKFCSVSNFTAKTGYTSLLHQFATQISGLLELFWICIWIPI